MVFPRRACPRGAICQRCLPRRDTVGLPQRFHVIFKGSPAGLNPSDLDVLEKCARSLTVRPPVSIRTDDASEP